MKDKKLMVFGVLNVVQGLIVGAIPLLVSSRIDAVNWVLTLASALMIISGPVLIFGGKWGRRLAASACLLHWLLGLVFAALSLMSASYLYGIYGRHGQSAGAMAAAVAVVIFIVFWLIPAHEIHFLRTRGESS